MYETTTIGLVILMVLGAGTLRAEGQMPLRALADARAFSIGTAVSARPLREDAAYRHLVVREFNMVTCENALKFGPLRPAPDCFAFDDADAIVAFAEAHAMTVRGHTLVWHKQMPGWIEEEALGRDASIDLIRGHIHAVTKRYRGRIAAWDVVNEAFTDDGRWRDTFYLRELGPDYIKMAFRWAHEGDPGAKLFYNDYGADGLNAKSRAVYRMVKGLLDDDVPIHGVGLQMHLVLGDVPSTCAVGANIRRLNRLGLEVHMTEMDVRAKTPVSEEDLCEQARVYGDLMRTCLKADNCPALVVWGATDRHSWVPGWFPGYGAPLLFDEEGHDKPAATTLREELGH